MDDRAIRDGHNTTTIPPAGWSSRAWRFFQLACCSWLLPPEASLTYASYIVHSILSFSARGRVKKNIVVHYTREKGGLLYGWSCFLPEDSWIILESRALNSTTRSGGKWMWSRESMLRRLNVTPLEKKIKPFYLSAADVSADFKAACKCQLPDVPTGWIRRWWWWWHSIVTLFLPW